MTGGKINNGQTWVGVIDGGRDIARPEHDIGPGGIGLRRETQDRGGKAGGENG
jgi:hypothetical protein